MKKRISLICSMVSIILGIYLLGFSGDSEDMHTVHAASTLTASARGEVVCVGVTGSTGDQDPQGTSCGNIVNVIHPPVSNNDDVLRLSQYIEYSMLQWAPAKNMPDKDVSHYPSISYDIASVTLASDEPALFSEKWEGSVLLTTIGFFEGHFWKHVDDGRCNDLKWRATRVGQGLLATTGNCDGGQAWTIFQIHPEGGLELISGGGWKHHPKKVGDSTSANGPDMISDRKIAARTSLHMLRASLKLGGGLCAYSGEPGPCPKANVRLEFARAWMKKVPFPTWSATH